jgi:hypothetical protein
MHDDIDIGRGQHPPEKRIPDISSDEFGALDLRRAIRVNPNDVLDLR